MRYAPLILVACFCSARRAAGQQVEPRVRLTPPVTTTLVTNTAAAAQSVTVDLYYPRYDATTPDTLRPVPALVSPRRFTLGPGERQVVRIALRGEHAPILRLVTCWTPIERVSASRVVIRSRLCLNALAEVRP